MSTLNLENMNLSEFSESRMESEYNYIDLTKKIKRKSSITEKRNYPIEIQNRTRAIFECTAIVCQYEKIRPISRTDFFRAGNVT